MKRLGIYFFFDKDGIVDSFVTYFIEDLMKSLDRLVIVCNGKLTEEGRKNLEVYTPEIIIRENKGLDVWAYKVGLEYVGWKICETFDEIVLCNSTSMGPVYPFFDMFDEMTKRELDFWGITKTHIIKDYDFGCNPYGYIPEHIQSYFIVYRKSLIQSAELQEYWTTMPEITTYDQSVGLYESVFTKKFADAGYKWDVYVNTDDFKGITYQPLMYYPEKLVRERKCPVFKRRSFFHMYEDVLANMAGQSSILLYDFLASTKLYDVNMIWDNILRCYNLKDIARQLHLNYTLSSRISDSQSVREILKKKRIALLMHLYFEDMLEESLKLASSIPIEADVYITTTTVEKQRKIEEVFSRLTCNKLEVRVVENRGRDVSALLVGMRDIVFDYDLVCFMHDKKTAQDNPGSVGESFAYKCYANTLYNKTYVENVVSLFEKSPRLGMIAPPAPLHGEYKYSYGRNWLGDYDNTKELCEELGVHVSIDVDKNPIAPYGSVFWFRPEAMRKLFVKNWKFDDFSEEPLPIDGTISHAVERSYGFVAQSEGYYSAVVMSDFFERIEYTNLDFYKANNQEIAELQWHLSAVYNSTSWKISKPIRVLGELIKKLTGKK